MENYLTVEDIRAHREKLRSLERPGKIALPIHPDSYGAQLLREGAADPNIDPEERAAFQAIVDKIDGKKEKP